VTYISTITLDLPSLLAALRGEERSGGHGLVCARPQCPQAGQIMLVADTAQANEEPHQSCITLETGELSSLLPQGRLHTALRGWLGSSPLLDGQRRPLLLEQLDSLGWAALAEDALTEEEQQDWFLAEGYVQLAAQTLASRLNAEQKQHGVVFTAP
jgi:hypothetical protein